MLPPKQIAVVVAVLALAGCQRAPHRKVIVLAVDGMDPGFVEKHWSDLPNLSRLREQGSYARLATTDPPQSPVAWSTFITGLDPVDHGIFDFVQRDAATGEPYLSITRTTEPRFVVPLGAWQLPLVSSRVVSLRKGRPFWEALADQGVPVNVMRLPSNYPPSKAGHELSGMGVPDLRGTEGTFTFFTSDPLEASHEVTGGLIRRVDVVNGRVVLNPEGPSNTLRRDGARLSTQITVDIDPDRPYVRLETGTRTVILKEGEWSQWLTAEFPLLPHLASAHGMFRVFLKQAHPDLQLYVSPVNVDPLHADLRITAPASYARDLATRVGRWSTLGIPEDTAALRDGIFDLSQFLAQSRLVLDEERRLFHDALAHYDNGLLIFYFSAVDQNSHMLFGKHDDQLLTFYRAIDEAIGETRKREPDAELIVLSDHGFTSFERAVHLNRWLADHGFAGKAKALGLNGLYVKDHSVLPEICRRLLEFRDPLNGRQVITRVTETHASPDLVVGYAPGYRASWQTSAGETPNALIEDNDDPWLADHCVDPDAVPGVLFATKPLRVADPALRDLAVSLLAEYGMAPAAAMHGRPLFFEAK